MGDMLRSTTMASAFPALAQRVNGAPLAYLDNAATTHVPQPVLAAIRGFDEHDRANIHRGVHTLSQRATDAYERSRDTLARFVGASDDHLLVFTSGTTDSLNLVAHGLSLAGHTRSVLREGDEIVVSALEHHANLVPWQMAARRCGATLRILHPDSHGRLHVQDLERLLTPRTRVFAVTACSNATAGALTVLDAAQAVGHEVPDLSKLACDFMAFSGHKMYGPMGTGALVGRRDALERLVPLRFGGDMVSWVGETDATFAALPARLEGGTPNVAGAVGIAAAADYIDAIGRTLIDAHVRALRDHAAAGLAALDGVTVLAPQSPSAIVSFVADDAHPHDIGTLLDERGIAVRTGFHCAQPLLDRLGCGPTTRASFALYNTHDEVERLVAGVAQALKVLR